MAGVMAKTKPAAKPPKKKPTPPADPPGALRLEYRSPAELAENPLNWRRHPDTQLSALSDVITEVGWAGACLFNERTGRLIDGHARRKVAIEQGCEKVPVLVGDWSEADEAKILATLDPLAAMAEADAAALDALLRDVKTGSQAVADMLTGLAEGAGVIPKDVTPGGGGDEFDATPEEAGPTRTAVGDLWVIGGKHRLIVGDNTDPENVRRLMDGKTVGLCFTSPPYGQQRDYGEAAKEKVQDWHALMCGTFANLPMDPAGQVLVNLGLIHREGEWVPYWDEWIGWMRHQGWRRFGWYVWDQGSGLPGDWCGRFAPSFEFVWHFNRETVKPLHTVPKAEGSIRDRTGDACMRLGAERTQTASSGKASLNTHKIPDSVIRVQRASGKTGTGDYHPAVYPVAFPTVALECWPSDVYDPFLGSGTTLIAAHRLGRTCYGCELEPKYADVVLRRSEAEGLTVEKVGG